MAQALLFNIVGEKRGKILLLLTRLGIRCREVPPKDFGKQIGALTGREGFAPEAGGAASFTDELLLLDGLDEGQLDALLGGLRAAQAPVALKAVVTEQNLRWTPAQLHRALAEEHAAMQKKRRK